jgi:hypothetical protein
MTAIRAFVALGLILGLSSGLAYAKPKNGEPAAPKKEPAALVGTVLKVDGTKIVLQTHGKAAGELTVLTDANTQFEAKGKSAAITDIKPGHEVVVTPPTGTAQKVVVVEDPKKGGKKKKK